MTDSPKPTHMDPMTPAEVTDLLCSTMQGDLPRTIMHRIFVTLAAWAPKMGQMGSPLATPLQLKALECFDGFMERAEADSGHDTGESLEVMQRLADSLRPHQADVETLFGGCATRADLAAALYVVLLSKDLDVTLIYKLHTQACARNGWVVSNHIT